MSQTPILIAGPTASGKSALALAVARARKGAIVNTDSMQIYSGLGVLTASPSRSELAEAPHFLYGALDPAVRCSVGQWARLAADALVEIESEGLVPIFVGGTGLYFRALTQGLTAIPPVPADVRARADALIAEEGTGGLFADLVARDPGTAKNLAPGDRQRIQRAWEVLEATGHGLSAWQDRQDEPVWDGPVQRLALAPPRDWLYQRCDSRFDAMLDQGAIEEVGALLRRGLDPALPAMKALGVREIAAYIAGDISLQEAAERAKMLTRRYAKRQMTWMRNQMADWPRIDPSQSGAIDAALDALKEGSP